jgi:hypothetical protein
MRLTRLDHLVDEFSHRELTTFGIFSISLESVRMAPSNAWLAMGFSLPDH